MSTDNPPLASISRDFTWPTPDLARLVHTLHEHVLPALGAEATFSTNVTYRGDAEVRRNYDTIEEWEGALNPSIDSATFSGSSHNDAWRIYVDAHYADGGLYLSIHAPEPAIDAAQHVVAQVTADLNLRSREEREALTVAWERAYFLAKPEHVPAWAGHLLDPEMHPEGGKVRFDGELKFGSPGGYSVRLGDFHRWLEELGERWNSLTAVTCDTRLPDAGLRFTWELTTDSLRLNVEAPTTEKAEALLQAFERTLGLDPASGAPTSRSLLEGEERRYAVKGGVSKEWFDRVVLAVTSHIRGDSYIDLRARVASRPLQALSWQSIDRWHHFVSEAWDDLSEARAYVSGPSQVLTLVYDHLRERLAVEIKSRTAATTDALFVELAGKLDLKQLFEDDYSEPRSSATYTIPLFSNSAFAEEIQKITALHFPGKHALLEAKVLEPIDGAPEDDEKLAWVRYPSLAAFIERIQAERRYAEVHLRLEGPRGKGLSLRITDNCSKLEIRSSEPPGEFKSMVAQLEKRLKLRKSPSATPNPERAGLKDSMWILLVLPMVTAFLTGTLFSDSFRAWSTPQARIEIVSPDSVAVVSGPIEVWWKLHVQQWGRDHLYGDRPANLELMKDARIVRRTNGIAPGHRENLGPGRYKLFLEVPDYGARSSVTFDVRPVPAGPP